MPEALGSPHPRISVGPAKRIKLPSSTSTQPDGPAAEFAVKKLDREGEGSELILEYILKRAGMTI